MTIPSSIQFRENLLDSFLLVFPFYLAARHDFKELNLPWRQLLLQEFFVSLEFQVFGILWLHINRVCNGVEFYLWSVCLKRTHTFILRTDSCLQIVYLPRNLESLVLKGVFLRVHYWGSSLNIMQELILSSLVLFSVLDHKFAAQSLSWMKSAFCYAILIHCLKYILP